MLENGRHPNYELLNLIGYGLAKFDMNFVRCLGFNTKSALYKSLVDAGVAETVGTIKNRQDLFDPFFDSGRKGWHHKGEAYIHRKHLIDSLFGSLDAKEYAKIVQISISEIFPGAIKNPLLISPILLSRYRQLHETGKQAESFFLNNFQEIAVFNTGLLEDARLYGDGYDFQISVASEDYLVEVKGVRAKTGAIRMTEKEHSQAQRYAGNYALVVVYDMDLLPKLSTVFDPTKSLDLVRSDSRVVQVSYNCISQIWE